MEQYLYYKKIEKIIAELCDDVLNNGYDESKVNAICNLTESLAKLFNK